MTSMAFGGGDYDEALRESEQDRTESIITADTDDDVHELYRLGQQHATEDAVRLIRHHAALAGGNPRMKNLADRLEAGEHTSKGAKARRKAE